VTPASSARQATLDSPCRQRPEDLDPGRVAEHPKRLGGELNPLVVGHLEIRQGVVHAVSISAQVLFQLV
jgi:hypothetical protein